MIVWVVKTSKGEYYAGDGCVDTRIENAFTMSEETAKNVCKILKDYWKFKPVKVEIKEVEE